MKKGIVFGLTALACAFASAVSVKVDCSKPFGQVKPVNGVGQPPTLGVMNYGMFHYLKEAGIPFSRLHDVGGAFGKNVYVDIPNLFRDFDADPDNPASYDFAFTDKLLEALVKNGVERSSVLASRSRITSRSRPTVSTPRRITSSGRRSANT